MIPGSVLAFAGVLAAVLVRRTRMEEAVLKATFVAMLAAPLLGVLPKIDMGFDLPLLGSRVLVHESGMVLVDPPLRVESDALLAIWIAGVAIAVARISIAWIAIMRSLPDGPVVVSPGVRVPMVAGILRPRIVLPPASEFWSAERRAAVLAHESSHLARGDARWAALAAFVRALYWFHPAAALAQRRLGALAELAADADAIRATGDPHKYAEHLVFFARELPQARLPAMARSSVALRIETILAGHAVTPAPPPAIRLFVAATFAVLTVICTMSTNVQAYSEPVAADLASRDEIRDAIRSAARAPRDWFLKGGRNALHRSLGRPVPSRLLRGIRAES